MNNSIVSLFYEALKAMGIFLGALLGFAFVISPIFLLAAFNPSVWFLIPSLLWIVWWACVGIVWMERKV